jgi:hypothetical protein
MTEIAPERGFVAVDRRGGGTGQPYWFPLGPTRDRAGTAALDAAVLEADLDVEVGTNFEFVIAVLENGDVVQVLDRDGDPLDWDADDRAALRHDISEAQRAK